ncbi:ribonuclease III [Ureaplasma sp. ES3154-GEN]|uniref:ribonuclease III n=1 Tax=Ureaplasma sp. ES3154-GEN TaxID=2984844 RepID=UPI0021E9470D|nr:ribonuclease III [Ureaplasma sp. ES3154-GEN]MCV3743750.1 ribonuclease III [Ureaplasma sp. ES3154-GEN]
MTSNKNNSLKILQFLKRLKIEPKTLSIYLEALTHKSYANEQQLQHDYQRLEFLGDACIQWVVTNFVFSYVNKDTNKKLNEGEMTRLRSKLVRRETLAKAAQNLGLDRLIMVGNGSEFKSTANMDKIYEDVFEAFIGAVAQDQGIKKVSRIIDQTLISYFLTGNVNLQKDYKTIFQEAVQKNSMASIQYRLISTDEPVKEVHLLWDGLVYGIGKGQNRKEAEQKAAADAFSKFKNSNH